MKTIDEYLAQAEPRHAEVLERIRILIKREVPEAVEGIGYGMPSYKYKGKPLIYFASFKNHMSLFPTPGPIEALRTQLQGYKVTKGTIQFTLEKPLPDEFIVAFVRQRKADIEGEPVL